MKQAIASFGLTRKMDQKDGRVKEDQQKILDITAVDLVQDKHCRSAIRTHLLRGHGFALPLCLSLQIHKVQAPLEVYTRGQTANQPAATIGSCGYCAAIVGW